MDKLEQDKFILSVNKICEIYNSMRSHRVFSLKFKKDHLNNTIEDLDFFTFFYKQNKNIMVTFLRHMNNQDYYSMSVLISENNIEINKMDRKLVLSEMVKNAKEKQPSLLERYLKYFGLEKDFVNDFNALFKNYSIHKEEIENYINVLDEFINTLLYNVEEMYNVESLF